MAVLRLLAFDKSLANCFDDNEFFSATQIFGEKQEVISDAIYPGDIDTIVSQCGVGRNEAIRALNQTDGYLIDAMLLVTS